MILFGRLEFVRGMGENMDKRSKMWEEKKLRNFFSRFEKEKKKKGNRRDVMKKVSSCAKLCFTVGGLEPRIGEI